MLRLHILCGLHTWIAMGWCTSVCAADQPGVVLEEFIFETATFPQCHASTLATTSDGTLIVAWFGGTREKHRDVGVWVSRRISGAWTTSVEVANGIQYVKPDGTEHRHPCWNPVLFQPPSGPLLLFYKCGPSPSTWWGMVTESRDNGKSWSTPRRLPEHIDGPVKNKPIRLDDGTLLCGSSTEHDGWRVHFELTRDNGVTWQRLEPINDASRFNAIQPTILNHGDGRLQILCRSQEQVVVESWSDDHGQSWSKMKPSSLPNPNSGVDAITLADGRHLLVYNHTIRGGPSPRSREMLNVAISNDGATWQAAVLLENTPNAEFSYPAVIQTRDGLVHTTYTWKRQRVKYVVIDPSKLTPSPLRAGQWPL